jgi:hypothetical protein
MSAQASKERMGFLVFDADVSMCAGDTAGCP